jgi:cell division septal protein FtsQ
MGRKPGIALAEERMSNHRYAESGIGFGSAFALVISWAKWHSFWWALLHGVLGWVYVFYYFVIKHY